jgi:hypothetical protein
MLFLISTIQLLFLLLPQFVHLKKVIVEWIVSFAVSTVQVSLSVWPHFRQTTLTVDSCLSDAAFLSMTAISADLPNVCLFFVLFLFVLGFLVFAFGTSKCESFLGYLEQCSAFWTEVHFAHLIVACCRFLFI